MTQQKLAVSVIITMSYFLILLLCCLTRTCLGYDVLVVIGGMYIEQSVGYTVNAVEAIGPSNVCRLYNLPSQRHSLFGGW